MSEPPMYTNGRKPDFSTIPHYMIGGLRRYIECGILPGHFLTAVLSNDLMDACGRADDTNRHRLFDYAMFLHNQAPSTCFGSPERVTAWTGHHGMGLPDTSDD